MLCKQSTYRVMHPGHLWRACILLLLPSTGLRAENITPASIRQVNLITREIIYDPISHKIYASVPGSTGPGGNSVVPIDPQTGEVGLPIAVGSEPNHMAVSDDGKYLYVSLDTGDVRRVDLKTRKLAGMYHTGGVRQLAVLPGQSNVIVISCGENAGMGGGVMVVDNGIPRPDKGSPNSFAFTFGPRVFTYQNEISSWDFTAYSISQTGMTGRTSTGSLFFGNLAILGDGNGRVFTNNGQVVDPETQRLIGRPPNPGGWGHPPLPDPKTNRIFYMDGTHITSDDYTTFVALDTMDIPALKGGGTGLIRWGDNGLAFRTEKQVLLVQSRIVPPARPPADLALTVTHTPLTVTVGRSITCSLQVSNNGETAASGVALCFRVPEGLELVSAKCSQGQVTQTERLVSVDVGDLSIKQKITLTVIVTPVGAKKFITSAVVRGDQWDNHLENNLVEHLIDNTGGM